MDGSDTRRDKKANNEWIGSKLFGEITILTLMIIIIKYQPTNSPTRSVEVKGEEEESVSDAY